MFRTYFSFSVRRFFVFVFSTVFLLRSLHILLYVFFAFSISAGPAWGAGGRPESWNRDRWPPRPSRNKLTKLSVDYCSWFAKEARVLEYGEKKEEGGGWEDELGCSFFF